MSELGLNSEEEESIKTICEYLFFDQYSDSVSFERFEKCLQPLFASTNKNSFSMDEIFKQICGPKKKYITYHRFLKSYLNYKKSKENISPELKNFYNILFEKILQKDPTQIGKSKENCYNYSTTKSSNKRECISQIQILTDKSNVIHGINMTYDDVFENQMFPSSVENDLNISLELNLGIVDEKPIKQRQIGKLKEIKEKFYRDAITHIFGTVNSKNIISFLGFKCISGKAEFVGVPEGEGFLIGKFGMKFHSIKIQMTENGIHLLNPIFNENHRINFFIRRKYDKISEKDLNKDEEVLDEKHLNDINDEVNMDKFITTPIIKDDHFFNDKLKDEISGNDYKEIVNQTPRQWLIEKDKTKPQNKNKGQKIKSLDEALKTFEEENKKRGINPNQNNAYNSNNPPTLRNLNGKKMNLGKKGSKGSKNKITKKPGLKKLHKKKKFKKLRDEGENSNIPRWNGDKENMKNIDPYIFYKNKHNYKNLKNELARSIQEEIMETSEGEFTENKEALLEQIFPEISEYQGKVDINKNTKKPTLKKKKLKKKKILTKMNSGEPALKKQFSHDDLENDNNIIYSDALQIFNDFSDKNKNLKTSNNYSDDEDNLFGFGLSEKYYPSEEIDDNKILRARGGYSYVSLNNYNSTPRKNYQISYNTSSRTKSNYVGATKYTQNDPAKIRAAQEKWKKFNSQLKKVYGVYLLQTMGAIIKAMHAIDDDSKGKRRMFLSEKIKLLKLLEENEVIIDFLTQKDIKENGNEKGDEDTTDDEEEEEDILIPDEHPEKITSLTELEQNIKDIDNLLENKKLDEEKRQKLEKLKNLYLAHKNILIENETNNSKKEIINENKINVDMIIREEENRRKMAEKENQRILEEIERKKKEEEEKERLEKERLDKERLEKERLEKEKLEKEKEEKERIEKEKREKEKKKAELKIYKNQEIVPETTSWIDPIFKPEKKNLCPYDSQGWIFPENVTKADVAGWNNYIWARAEEIYDTQNYHIFHEGVTCDDIIQGSLGDCYFLSVLGSLCKYPKIIEKLFYSKEIPKSHQYGIFFFINGAWKLILIDDFFPARNTSFKKFAFGYSTNKELWVSLLEKAWAKINGCYAKVGAGGLPNEVFDVCTEAFSEYILIQKKSKADLWKIISESEKKNYIMTAGTTKNLNGVRLEKVGLTPGHAYAVLKALEIDTGTAVEKVVQLRNPWGNFEYSGDWSDYSSKWTDELKIKYEFNKKNDGIFYMAFNDFAQYFLTMGLSKLHENYVSNNIKINKLKNIKCQLIKIRVKNEGSKKINSFLQLYEKNPRIILKDGTYQKTALCFLILADSDFNYLVSSSGNKMHISVEYDLEPNKEYYIFSDVNYRYDPINKGKNHGYRITYYAEEEIIFENVTENNKYNVGDLLRKTMIDYCKKKVKKSKSNGMNIYATPSYSDDFPFSVTYFENEKNPDNLVTLNITYKGDKSFCYYCDDIATEEDIKLEKELPKDGSQIVLLMKYNLSSIFSLNYLFKTDKRTQEQKDEYNKKKKRNQNNNNEEESSNANSKVDENKDNKSNINKNEEKKAAETKEKEKNTSNKTTTNNNKNNTTTNNNKTNTTTNNNKKSSSNNVFDEEGEPIVPNSDLIQYVKEISGGYIIGIENKSKKKKRVRLNIEGLELTDAAFRGRGSPSFYIDPKDKRIINAKIKSGYSGDLSFQFEEL